MNIYLIIELSRNIKLFFTKTSKMVSTKFGVSCIVQAQKVLLALTPGGVLSQSSVGYNSIRKCNLLDSIYSFKCY